MRLDELVCAVLPQAPLWLAIDDKDQALAFMWLEDGDMQALFVHPDQHGQGLGAALVRHGLGLHPHMGTDVNEQNAQALGFYEKMGFRRTGRSELDSQGRPYPSIHLSY